MASVSYSWATDVAGFTLNVVTTGNQADVAVAATAGGGYLGAWSVGSAYVRGRYVAADGTPGLEDPLNVTAQGNQFDASMALLGNGHNVVTFTDDSSGTDTVRIRILGENAVGNEVDFAVPANSRPLRESDVTALGSDGFAVAYTRDYGSGDTDVFVQRYEADGDAIGGVIPVDSAALLATDHASITGLGSGGFVVAWEQSATAGGNHSVWFQLYDATGTRVTVAGDAANTHHLIDDIGSINQDIQVAALQDGGFVVAYADNGGEGADGTEITAQVFNADGTERSDYLRVNTDTDGNQARPTVTVLSNGYFVVGWVDEAGFFYCQAYDPSGAAIGANFIGTSNAIEAEIAALADGQLASVRESTITDGDGNSVRSSVHALVRTTTGTAADETLTGDSLRDTMNGAGGVDILDGGGADDDLSGGAGDDTLRGGAGADELDGSTGTDTVSYYTSSVGVAVNLALGTASTGDAEGDSLTSIENISGSQGHDGLFGNAGANKLQGWNGNDLLTGGAGADVLDGGAGTDTANYSSVAGVTIDLAAGTASGGDAAGDVLSSIENLLGSVGNDVFTGTSGANKLQGWSGDDVLRGGAGADTIEGGAGIDIASYYTSAAGVTVDLGADTASGGDAAGDSLSTIENLSGSNQGNDVLAGDVGANKLQGWGGDDVLRGGAGADTLEGGAGTDTASYYTGMVGVTIDLVTGAASGGDAQGDVLIGIENLSGSQGNDVLEGNAGANVLQGWGGDDSLVGNLGKDTLTGGAGADRYTFTDPDDSVVGANADVVTDFSHAQGDQIDVNIIDANTGVAGNQAFSFIGANLYSGAAGQLRYAVANGVTTIAGDVNGDKVSDFHIALTGSIALVAADFGL